jgi:hypothetical protein
MKMRKSIWGSVLLVGTCLLTATCASAQQIPNLSKQSPVSADLAVTYTTQRGQLEGVNGGSFWLQGGSANGGVTFWKGLGIAANLSGGHGSNLGPGVDLNQIEYTAGPRYTLPVWTGHAGPTDQRRLQLFSQGLFGRVHAFDGVFPSSSGATSSAGSFAIDAGGGLDLFLSKRLGVRLVEADYVRTTLPNSGANVQTDLRLSAGITYHIGKRRKGIQLN